MPIHSTLSQPTQAITTNNIKLQIMIHFWNYETVYLLILPPSVSKDINTKGNETNTRPFLKKLNIKVDHIIGSNAKVTLEKYILNTAVETYINDKNILNNYISVIRYYYGKTETKSCLMHKYHWNKSALTDIE